MSPIVASEILSFDTCCCGQHDCQRLHHWKSTLHKLEIDARLAAEIGQSLLQKHQKYVVETDQTRNELQRKLQEYRERIHVLERAAEQSDWENQQEVDQDKAKWYWKWKRTQTTLDATAADLDVANTKCAQFTKALRDQEAEAEKLEVYKSTARESAAREEALRAKLDEALQEIEALRKNEKVLETQYKKIKEEHETLFYAYERLESSLTIRQEKMAKKTRAMAKQKSVAEPGSKRGTNATPTVSSSAIDTSSFENENDKRITTLTTTARGRQKGRKNSWSDGSAVAVSQGSPLQLVSSMSTPVPAAVTNLDNSVHHHHYHYYVQSKPTQDQHLLVSTQQQQQSRELGPISVTEPYYEEGLLMSMLHTMVSQALEQLRATDILTLNRRLGCTFDICQMSQLSNSAIEDILNETEQLDTQAANASTDERAAIIRLYQEMLREIGHLRATLNDLQVEYVQKVEEKRVLLLQQQQQQQQQQRQRQQQPPSPTFSWILSNVFQRPTSPPPSVPPPLSPSSSRRRFDTRSISSESLSPTPRRSRSRQQQQYDRVVGSVTAIPELDLDWKVRGSLSTSLLMSK